MRVRTIHKYTKREDYNPARKAGEEHSEYTDCKVRVYRTERRWKNYIKYHKKQVDWTNKMMHNTYGTGGWYKYTSYIEAYDEDNKLAEIYDPAGIRPKEDEDETSNS